MNNNILEKKIVFLEKVTWLLRSEIQNKQDTTQKLLKNNTTLVESINTKLTLPTQNKTNFIKSVFIMSVQKTDFINKEKENKDLKLSRKIETSEAISSADAKIRDRQEKENRNKKSRRQAYIICDSMTKHISGPGISKIDQVKVKTHPGATTDDIIDCIKTTICQKPDIVMFHSETNDLTKNTNIMSRVPTVAAAVKETETEGEKWAFMALLVEVI